MTSLSEQRLHTKWQRKALTKLLGLQYRICYKRGVDNSVADSLSRKPHSSLDVLPEMHLISSAQPAWLEDIMQSYVGDKFCTELLQKLSTSSSSDSKFTLTASILRTENCVWVDDVPKLHKQILSAFHDSPIGGHSGFPVTYRRIR